MNISAEMDRQNRKGCSLFQSYLCMFSALFFALSISGCTQEEQAYKESRILMDTYCTITVISSSEEKARKSINVGFEEIKKLETLLNFFSDDSEVSVLNRSAGAKPVKVSPETLDIIIKMKEIARATGGAFDATIAPVVRQWTFSKEPSVPSIPARDVIEKARALVDYKKIRIDRNSSEIFLEKKGMEIDLGGIAKGYAADRAVEAIKTTGITSALVAVAGDIRGFGKNLSGSGWNVGVQNPRPAAESDKPWEDICAVLHLNDRAISTSGDYQRFFMKEGIRYHHILDPATGFPAESGLISVSVIAPEGYIADSLSTAVFILGAEKGIKLLESFGSEGILVTSEKKILLTSRLIGQVEVLNKEYQLEH